MRRNELTFVSSLSVRLFVLVQLDWLQRRRRSDPFEEKRVVGKLFRSGSEAGRGFPVSSPQSLDLPFRSPSFSFTRRRATGRELGN